MPPQPDHVDEYDRHWSDHFHDEAEALRVRRRWLGAMASGWVIAVLIGAALVLS